MASDYLLEIDGIKGESKDDRHKGAIDVMSFSWGLARGGSAGGQELFEKHFTFTSGVHKGSPILLMACASGKHIPKAVLYVRKSASAPVDFYQLTLTDCLVSSADHGGDDGGVPLESISFNYAKIEFKYVSPNGSSITSGEITPTGQVP